MRKKHCKKGTLVRIHPGKYFCRSKPLGWVSVEWGELGWIAEDRSPGDLLLAVEVVGLGTLLVPRHSLQKVTERRQKFVVAGSTPAV